MRRPADFARTIRSGSRAGRSTLVVHCLLDDEPGAHVGFVVARTVGNAVVRNRVRRRLRGVVIELTDMLPSGTHVVVRALPASASADYDLLRTELRSALGSASRKAEARRSAGGAAR